MPTNTTLKPVLKLTPASNNPNLHLSIPPSDFSALITAAIKARPSPRRNCPDFHFCDTQRAPVAPPPTPAMRFGDGEDADTVAGELEEMALTPGSEVSGRTSYEGRRSFDSMGRERRVRFEEQ